jgi:predicted ArsR family transcriptional regulator
MNPTRYKLHSTKKLILRSLEKNGTQTVQQVSDEVGVGYTGVARALRNLWDRKLVTVTYKSGGKSYWRIRHAPKGSAENGSVQGGEG